MSKKRLVRESYGYLMVIVVCLIGGEDENTVCEPVRSEVGSLGCWDTGVRSRPQRWDWGCVAPATATTASWGLPSSQRHKARHWHPV